MNTRSEQEHIEHILTKQALEDWCSSKTGKELIYIFNKYPDKSLVECYLKEHGLPTDSIIKGL